MCPFSGLVQLLIVVVTLLLICQCVCASGDWKISCNPREPQVIMYDQVTMTCEIDGPPVVYGEVWMLLESEDPDILKVPKKIWLKKIKRTSQFEKETFQIKGEFLGKTNVSVSIKEGTKQPEQVTSFAAKVIREKTALDHIFTGSVAVLVSLMYINFGCALNWEELKQNIKRPIGPVIGFIGQFLFMPLISFSIGKLIFPDNIPMQLGMFFTGVSPGGGASNMWTVILGGNMDLSITMTTISTFAAFGMMPLWLFTLGRVLFEDGQMEVPYRMISTYAISLVIPLFIGFLIKRYLKKTAHFLARILKGFSSFLLIFIVVFAIVTNLYLFKLFSWQIIIAGLGLPWLGYTIAYFLARIFRQPGADCLAIAVETGIQNTGISIFMLRFSLGNPEADLTTVVPVAVAIMTPIPLFCLFIYQKIKARCCMTHGKLENSELNSPMSDLDIDGAKRPKLISTIS